MFTVHTIVLRVIQGRNMRLIIQTDPQVLSLLNRSYGI